MSNNFTYEHLPKYLKDLPQWILFKLVYIPEKEKWSKVPIQINGFGASTTNKQHYARFLDAQFAYSMGVGDGLGFCFTTEDDLVFVDIDGAVIDGAWRSDVPEIMQQFPTWGEISHSGKGLHYFAKATLDRARAPKNLGLELYSEGRFVALTGWHLEGTPDNIAPCQAGTDWLAAHIDRLTSSGDALSEQCDDTPPLEPSPALQSLSISPDIYSFLTHGVADKWGGDRSSALLAASMSLYRCGLSDGQVLGVMWDHCSHIAQEHRVNGNAIDWLWKYNVARGRGAKPPSTENLFEAVPTSSQDVLSLLLAKVAQLETGSISDTKTIHLARKILIETTNLDAGSKIAVRDAVRKAMTWTKPELQTVQKEIERESRRIRLESGGGLNALMSGYVYVAKMHVFLHKETGVFLKPEAFVALHTHISPELRDTALSCEGVDKVIGVDFDPIQPEFFNRNGGKYYNTWRGIQSIGVPGDITPWWNHLCLLVKNEKERNHLLDWMAFSLQNPGIKINHCVVMGGSFGIGKDTLFWPLFQGFGRHAVQMQAQVLFDNFNEYLNEAKLVVLQEVEMGSIKDAKIVDNKLKPMIASPPDTLYVNPKGSGGYHIQNVCHLVMFYNGTHPVIIDKGDRRYFVIESDLIVYGSDGEQTPRWVDYFNALWCWLKAQEGWQTVIYYLLARDVSQFNPKAAPPMTEGKKEIIEQSRNTVERLMADAINSKQGPFAHDIVYPTDVQSWLSLEGLTLVHRCGLTEVPSTIVIGRGLKSAGACLRRVRMMKGAEQTRIWIIRNQQKWVEASTEDLRKELEK